MAGSLRHSGRPRRGLHPSPGPTGGRATRSRVIRRLGQRLRSRLGRRRTPPAGAGARGRVPPRRARLRPGLRPRRRVRLRPLVVRRHRRHAGAQRVRHPQRRPGRPLEEVEFKPGSNRCDVVGGHFVDPYTGTAMDYAREGSQIHVDHLFPLAAAWDLGAASWPLPRRERFANDPDLELLAVQGGANLAKGDSTPASWIPPHKPYRCAYVTSYLEVAHAYDLAITAADVRVIEAVVRKSVLR